MSKFKNARFEFEVEPEDSEFLKSWNELRESEEFKERLEELKEMSDKDSTEIVRKSLKKY